jgi:subtilisin family serine protease
MKKFQGLLLSALILVLIPSSTLGGQQKFNSSLRLLHRLHMTPPSAKTTNPNLARALESDKITVTIKFDHTLSGTEIAGYEQSGVEFYYIDGMIARTRSIYPARVSWDRLDEMGGRAEVLRMESKWRPAVYPTLDVSASEIEAVATWDCTDPLGLPLTGKGMRIADFDTGIDVFHPSFFYADGDTFDWIDRNTNGIFNPGTDAVDLNKNEQYDTGELLRFFDGWVMDYGGAFGFGGTCNNDNLYQPHWDWLYNDQNGNAQREFGPGAGFTESDPTFGELLMISLDENDNAKLDVGEKLVALGTSKIYATLGTGSVERLRGVDLIQSDDDVSGHGTSVSGILAGGTRGQHIFTGIAPDAEILAGNVFSDVPISYLIPWARAKGADVMLYEFGSFVWDFLDGSSLDEELITIENASTIQITPSGNLARGSKHAVTTIEPSDSVTLHIYVPIIYSGDAIRELYGTTLCRTYSPDLTFRLMTPVGGEITLNGDNQYVDGFYVWSDYSSSPRGTHKFDLYIDNNTNPSLYGTWHLTIVNTSWARIEIINNVADDRSSWAGGAEFTNYVSNDRNVTLPATSDSSLVNGSYSTRGYEGYGGVGSGSIPVGEISAFSGRGARIDGWHLLDLCSPGNYDVYTTRSHTDGSGYPLGSYRQFSGTSAAGPHVAAAAALVQQAFPTATMDQVAHLLTSSAAADAFTGPVYNDTWGWGKLRILAAINIASTIEEMADGRRAPQLFLDQNYPNPFNPTTWIPFYLPQDGMASVKVYNVKGELVKVLRDRYYGQGAHSVQWDGTDSRGQKVASGLYFCVLRQGGDKQTRKMVLIK